MKKSLICAIACISAVHCYGKDIYVNLNFTSKSHQDISKLHNQPLNVNYNYNATYQDMKIDTKKHLADLINRINDLLVDHKITNAAIQSIKYQGEELLDKIKKNPTIGSLNLIEKESIKNISKSTISSDKNPTLYITLA